MRLALGAPEGFFSFLQDAPRGGMYPREVTIVNKWGMIPYVVKTNQLGLRGDELSENDLKLKKIVAIGDSFTDGFYVDNDATYTHYLQEEIDERLGRKYIVLNAARGGGSIDKEFSILKRVALPLKPDIILFQFCTNDIKDIAGRSLERLVKKGKTGFHRQDMHFKRYLTTWFITRTAIGEVIYKAYWNRFVHPNPPTPVFDRTRYVIEGGDNTWENVALFNRKNRNSDGIVLREPFTAEAGRAIDIYCELFSLFADECKEHNVSLIFVYMPNYSQIYDESTSMKIRDVLYDKCKELRVKFLDLTPHFRREAKGKVLHLVPLDFHLNPEGNRVMAQGIYEFFAENDLL